MEKIYKKYENIITLKKRPANSETGLFVIGPLPNIIRDVGLVSNSARKQLKISQEVKVPSEAYRLPDQALKYLPEQAPDSWSC